MPREILTVTENGREDARIVELTSSALEHDDDGSLEVCLLPQEAAGILEMGVRLTEDDALALADVLRRAAQLVARREPQAFISLLIHEPE